MNKARDTVMLVVSALVLLTCAHSFAQPVELTNQYMTIRFDPEDGYAISGIIDRAHNINFIEPRPEGVEEDRSPWLITLRWPEFNHKLTAADAVQVRHSLNGDTLTITWRGISSDEVPADITVTATIRLPADSRKAYLHAEISGTARGYLWQFDFPRVFGVREFADCQMSVPQYWGRLVRKPQQLGRQGRLIYPEPASMQWFAYWGVDDDRDPPLAEAEGRDPETGWSVDYSDAVGLYWAAEDGEVYVKRFAWDPTNEGEQLSWHIENIPALPTWPMPEATRPVEVEYSMPYDVVIGVFTGDWHEAAQMYLEWAEDQVWTQRGPVDQWPEQMPPPGSEELIHWTPPWFREIGFWAKFYHEPAKILPEWAAYRKWLGVPMASHWYRYNVASFNDNDPEHLPPDPYVLDGVRAARELGVEPMPYVLSTIWDTDTQSWIRQNGIKSAVKTEAGDIIPWVIGNNIFAWMCLSQEQWQAKMRDICEKLIWEHGMSGVYLDVLAAGAAKLCYDPSHGHTVHGGNYWGQGARELMTKLRADIRRLTPDACFFTEEIGEHLIDVMDGYLTLDLTRSYTPGGEQVWPILTAVYHPYTINFGSDAWLGMEPERFALVYGLQLVWGSQPLNSNIIAPAPQEGDPNSEILREYTRAYWVAGQPFLMGGRMLRVAVRPRGGHESRCALELVADEHVVEYDLRQNRRKIWTGPAVLASAWQRFGDIAIVMANITGETQEVDLTVRGDVLSLQGEQIVRLWPGEPEIMDEAAGQHSLALAPWRCMVLVITDDPQAAIGRLNELQKTPWELEVVQDGPLPPVSGPDGALFACSDGPVLNQPGEGGTVATAYFVDEQGDLQPRVGRQAEVVGPQAEGHGLPRDLDEQPFALLRRVPHTAKIMEPGIMVFSGDEDHLLAAAPGGTELSFDKPGLLVITNAATGEIMRPISAKPTDSTVLPQGEVFIVGWARIERSDIEELLSFGDAAIRRRVQPFADRMLALARAASNTRPAALAEASRAFVKMARGAGDLPGLLSPVSPVTKLWERLHTLLVAQLATNITLDTQHRWLAPRLDKAVEARVSGLEVESVELIPTGFWRRGSFVVERTGRPTNVGDTTIYRWTVRLDDGNYVERVIPLVAVATMRRDGNQYALTDILRLEANRPYQLKYSKEAITCVAGQPRTVRIAARNWSPIDLHLQLEGTGPEGWLVNPEATDIDVPALSDQGFTVRIMPPEDAERGTYRIRVTTNHAAQDDTLFVAFLQVDVLDALVPLMQDVAEWEHPSPEQRARIRHSSKFAIYATAGEELGITIHNIRVTRYVDTLTWRLLAPNMSELDSGTIPVDESVEIRHQARVSGTYYLEVVPKQGSADVIIANRAVAEVATKQSPLQLFTSSITRYFYVPEGAESFRLGARDGGPTEGAHFVITSPTGRVAFEADGNYNGAEFPVRVEPNEAGRLWTFRVEPQQDIAFWFAGDVLPYLSTSPERVLVRASD